jgi:hypothetical protein
MSFYTSFRPLPLALGQINPGSVVIQSMPASNANSYNRRQADLRIQAETEELMNEYNNNNNNNNLFFHQSSRYIKVWLKLHEYIINSAQLFRIIQNSELFRIWRGLGA